MQTTSELYKELLRSDARIETKAVIAGETYGEDRLCAGGVSVSSAALSGGKFVGNCNYSVLRVSVRNPGAIPTMAKIELFIRLTDGDRVSEWVKKGTFYIDERDYDEESDTLSIVSYDAMLKTEQPFTTTGDQGGWPMTDRAVVDEVCQRIGVALDARTAEILTKGYAVQYPGYGEGAYTMREVLGYLGAMYAGNWIISDAGELRLIVLGDIPPETNYIIEEHGDAITLGGIRLLHTAAKETAASSSTADKTYLGMNVSKLDTAPAFDTYSKVIITVGQTTDANGNTVDLIYEAGDDTGRELAFECPWGTQAIANDVLARVKGYAYQPYTATGALLDPAAELGDGVTVNGLYSVIAAMDVTFDALYTADISAPGDEEVGHEYPYESSPQRAIERKIAGVRTSLKVGLDSITAEVSNFETGVNSSLSVMDGQIASKISGSEAQSLIDQTMNSITLSVSSSASGTSITLTDGSISVSSPSVALHVNALNIDGTIIADVVDAHTSITSPNIYGGAFYDDAGSYKLQLGQSSVTSSYKGMRLIRENDPFGYGSIFEVMNSTKDYVNLLAKDYLFMTVGRSDTINGGTVTIHGGLVLPYNFGFGPFLPDPGTFGRIFFLKQ